MLFWMSNLQSPLVQNNFDMFLDEWTSLEVWAGKKTFSKLYHADNKYKHYYNTTTLPTTHCI